MYLSPRVQVTSGIHKQKKQARRSNFPRTSAADAPPAPMAPAAASPKLSPLSLHHSPVSPSRLREDPTAFHMLGSEEGDAYGDADGSVSAYETTFHCEPASPVESGAGSSATAAREAFTHYYRRYYRRYLRKYARPHQHRRKKSDDD